MSAVYSLVLFAFLASSPSAKKEFRSIFFLSPVTLCSLSPSSKGVIKTKEQGTSNVFFISVICLECYNCRSAISFQDCQSNQTKISCWSSSGPPSCVSASLKVTQTIYTKGCAANCTTLQSTCQALGAARYEINCCESDLYNDQISSTPPPTRFPTTGNLATRSAKGDIFSSVNVIILLFSVCF